MEIEIVEHRGLRYAEILPANVKIKETVFFSKQESGFQFGVISQKTGYMERAHYHIKSDGCQVSSSEFFFIRSGRITIRFYDEESLEFHQRSLSQGDAFVLIDGSHSYEVDDSFVAVVVKQGPFRNGADKVWMSTDDKGI